MFNRLRNYAYSYSYDRAKPVDLSSQQFNDDLMAGDHCCGFVSASFSAALYEMLEFLGVDREHTYRQTIFPVFGKKGNYIATHNHKNSHFTAVLYVDVPDGDLVLYDPRSNANRGYPPELEHMFEPVRFLPKNGDLILIPSFVFHESLVTMSDQPRIIFVSDIRLQFHK